ncbi:hypothetical protein V8C42DRAFT_318698 [Trichoderma barbatum]
MMKKIILGTLGLIISVAATPVELVERSSCRDDSLYKCFASKEYSQSATAYCSALNPAIRTVTAVVPVVTTTVLVTSTAAAVTDFLSSITTVYTATVPSATEIATETDNETAIATAVETEIETATETETEIATQTAIQTATQTVTSTVTVTSGQAPPSSPVTFIQTKAPAKRDGSPQPPKCMITKCFVYSPERITAACECINVPPETITITQAGPSSTVTVTSTSATTPHVTATAWQTVAAELSNGVATKTAIVTNIMTYTITNVVTNTITNTITNTFTNTVTSTVTVTATTTTTVTVTPTPTLGPNLITNGDFSNGLAGWSTFQSVPGVWTNIGVSSLGSPDGSFALHASNVRSNAPLIITSGPFILQAQSVYRYSLKMFTTSADTTWMKNIKFVVSCSSTITIMTRDFSQATGNPHEYYTSAGTISTPITSSPDVIRALGNCQLQVALPVTTTIPSTWLMTGAVFQFDRPISF